MSKMWIFRLYLLRAMYLLIGVWEGSNVWPTLLFHASTMELWHGLAIALLWAMCALDLLGIRYPLRMLPLLLFEIAWKSAWLLAVALPRLRNGTLDGDFLSTTYALVGVVIVWIVMPWPYIVEHYIKQPGDPWWWKAPRKSTPASDVPPSRGTFK